MQSLPALGSGLQPLLATAALPAASALLSQLGRQARSLSSLRPRTEPSTPAEAPVPAPGRARCGMQGAATARAAAAARAAAPRHAPSPSPPPSQARLRHPHPHLPHHLGR